MASGGQKRTRSERVAALELSPGQWERAWASLRRRDVLGRIGLALLAAVVMAVVIRAWNAPFGYRADYVPARNIVSSISFTQEDAEATRLSRQQAKGRVRYVYVHDPQPLVQLRAELLRKVEDVTEEDAPEEDVPEFWDEFLLWPVEGASSPTTQQRREQFREFRAALSGQGKLQLLAANLQAVFAPWEQWGLLEALPQDLEGGNQQQILVHLHGQPKTMPPVPVEVGNVLIGDGSQIHESLRAQLESDVVADHAFAWLRPRLMATLVLQDKQQTRQALIEAAENAPPVMRNYVAGSLLAQAGQPLRAENEIPRLKSEHEAILAQRTPGRKLARAAAAVAMIFAMFLLCGTYMRYRQRGPLASLTRLNVMLALAVITVAFARWPPVGAWRAEIVPLMLFGMTMSIVYRRELALLLSGVLALVLTLAVGQGLHEFLLLMGVTTTAILSIGRIRSRSKLIYVGLFAGAVAVLLQIALGVLVDNQPLDWEHWQLPTAAAWIGLWALAAGFVMTGLLPFIERLFGVLTDLTLLELGDVAHPLLQELIRRAPSTYNHSVTVGSIAEAAADSIGARGLLCRVGAYFHDIGKMLKPGYFVENQGSEENRHAALVPAMSSLVIVAHIKDGADLARQHHLPQPIVDLIEQHHGTTMVGFFYEQAARQKRSDPNGGEVDESTYRYPGPMPQTKEAAVLMLADSVEGASRTLVDPTPKRIESLVRELAERRLRGGQFDESGLTLRELRTIERSMVKSLTSIYHGRLKYPDQKTA